jgi:broad specificity phosphatase PhoE
MAVTIVYETHSLTTDNHAGIATGWNQGELSEEGRALAAELGQRRRNDGITTVYVSDLRRAIETAEIAFEASDIPVVQDSRLRECNYGELNGTPVTRLALERPLRIHEPFPGGGQSYLDVVKAMRAFLAELALRHQNERVLVISHSANKWALDYLILGIPLEDSVDRPFDWREGWEYSFEALAVT